MKLTSNNCSNRSHVCRRRRALDNHGGDLKRQTVPQACEDLVSNPLSRFRVELERVEQAGADSSKTGPGDEHRDRAARLGNGTSRNDSSDGDADDQGQVPHPGLGRVYAVDALKVDGQVVDGGEEAAREEKRKARAREGRPLRDQARWDGCTLPLESFPRSKSAEEGDAPDEKADNHAAFPGVANSSILQ